MIKKICMFWVVLTILVIGGIACNVEDFNLRTIYDVDRNYISADSTSYNMAWRTAAWREANIKYWNSAGLIITNEYNAFKQPYWLKKSVENQGFEGGILVRYDSQYINIDWMAQPSGTFEGDIFDKFVENNNAWLLRDEDDNIIFSDPNYIIDPAAFSDSTFRTELAAIFTEYMAALHIYLGEPIKVTYGYMFPDYNWQVYGPTQYMVSSNVDPFSIGKTLDQYTVTDLETYVHPYQDKIVATMNGAGILIIDGDRLEYETPGNSLLASKEINGVFFENPSLLSLLGKATSYRTAYTAVNANDALLFIYGGKTDVYHAVNPAWYGNTMKCVIDLGVYFTPGYDGTKYFNYPDQQLADWWLRNDEDSNWQSHLYSPTYATATVSPRELMDRTVYNTTLELGHPGLVHFHYQDFAADATIDYATAALNDATVIQIHAYREVATDGNAEPAWINYVDNVRAINPDFINLIYITVHPRYDWVVTGSTGLNNTLGKIWNMVDRTDTRLRGLGRPGAWLRDTSGNIVDNYNQNTRIINPAAYADGICDSLAVLYIGDLDELSNDREYTGVFIDWLSDDYPDWSCYTGCETALIDMDQDGNDYYGDDHTEEKAIYNAFSLALLQAIRDQYSERGMINRLIVVNDNYVRTNQDGANLVDGVLYEGFLQNYPAYVSTNWTQVTDTISDMFVNSLINPPMLMFETAYSDTSNGRFIIPYALAGNGWSNIKYATDRLGTTTMFGLPERLPAAGALVSKEWISMGTAGTKGDTLKVVMENYRAYGVIPDTADPRPPFPYLIITADGDTLSVGGMYRYVPDVTAPILSNVVTQCAGQPVSSEGGYADSNELAVYNVRYGTGPGPARIAYGDWLGYTPTPAMVFNNTISTIPVLANVYWGFQIMAKDAAGNVSLTSSAYFKVALDGNCP